MLRLLSVSRFSRFILQGSKRKREVQARQNPLNFCHGECANRHHPSTELNGQNMNIFNLKPDGKTELNLKNKSRTKTNKKFCFVFLVLSIAQGETTTIEAGQSVLKAASAFEQVERESSSLRGTVISVAGPVWNEHDEPEDK